MVTPCKDCFERYENCHSSCEKYKEWRSDFEEVKQRALSMKLREAQADAVKKSACRKMRKRQK